MPFDAAAYKRAWREANREHCKEYDRRWCAANKEKKKAAAARFRIRHPERVSEYEKMRWVLNGPALTRKHAEWVAKNPERTAEIDRLSSLRKKYGLTADAYRAMLLAQNGGCAVCGKPANSERFRVLGVDHDHATGIVRGLLCKTCNAGIGMFKDRDELCFAAGEYLRQHARPRLVIGQ